MSLIKCSFSTILAFLFLLCITGFLGGIFVFSSAGAIESHTTPSFFHAFGVKNPINGTGSAWLRSTTTVGGPVLLHLSWGSGGLVAPSLDCRGQRSSYQDFVDQNREYRVTRIVIVGDDCVGVHYLDDVRVEVAPRSFFEMTHALSASGVDMSVIRDLYRLNIPEDVTMLFGTGELLSSVSLQDEEETRSYLAPIGHLLGSGSVSRYISPVLDKPLTIRSDIIPNAPRPYRKQTTDAIHHGYDIFAPIGTPVVAPSTAWVMRITSGFVWQDFQKLKKSGDLTDLDRARNLDLYRGNQAWLITERGDIFVYSHLDTIEPLRVGERVIPGRVLGTVGDSGVPEKNYRFSHLHFEIIPSPFVEIPRKIPSVDMVLGWSWLGKGQTQQKMIETTEEIFASGVVIKK